jgi:transposase
MSDIKYVGIDVHAASCAICVMDQQGQVLMRSLVATQAETLRDVCRGLRGEVHVVLEEGTLAAWVREVLQSVVREVVVSNPRANRLLRVGNTWR